MVLCHGKAAGSGMSGAQRDPKIQGSTENQPQNHTGALIYCVCLHCLGNVQHGRAAGGSVPPGVVTAAASPAPAPRAAPAPPQPGKTSVPTSRRLRVQVIKSRR